MKKVYWGFAALFIILASASFAAVRFEFTAYGGPAVSNLEPSNTKASYGFSALIKFPTLKASALGIEVERYYCQTSTGAVVGISDVGAVIKLNINKKLPSIRFSAGNSTILSDGSFVVGSNTIAANIAQTGLYLAAAAEIPLYNNFVVLPKYTSILVKGEQISKASLNVGYKF
ncbi:MAG: hypothetical protein AABZ57_05975 [Candidatus Margulisiibacteriota bacterium]